MQDRLELMLEMQRELQKKHMKDGDPALLEGDQMADFMRWNAFALIDEISEAMQEVGWKPWATSRHINKEAFLKEMVDAFHFFMNLLICGTQGLPSSIIADTFTRLYLEKNAENARRQVEGYDGVEEKCPHCRRDLQSVGISQVATPSGVIVRCRGCGEVIEGHHG